MKKDVRVYIDDVLECIDKVEEYTEGVSEEEFYENTQIQDAVIRRLEIVGEAIKNRPVDFREQYPDIPWRKIAGMRDVLIHGYAGVNLLRVWRVVIDDLTRPQREIPRDGGEGKGGTLCSYVRMVVVLVVVSVVVSGNMASKKSSTKTESFLEL